MTTALATFAKALARSFHQDGARRPLPRPGTDIRHDADLRRVLRDLDAFP